jgi:hypothetical protein
MVGRACLLLLLLLGFATQARANWLVAETQHFRIHGTVSEARIRQEASVLEDFHRLVEFLTNRKFPDNAPKLDIYLVDGRSQMLIIRPGLGANVAGFYTATPGGILAMSLEPSGAQAILGRDVLLHEYAHHFMMQAGNSALPAWYVEGFAEYLMTADFRPDRIDFGGVNNGRYYVLTNMAWAPLEQILRRSRGVNVDSFYAQSWLLTHYLNRVEGMQAKRNAYLRKVAEGADPVEAFRQEIDPDLEAFQRRLRAYLSGRSLTFSRMKRQPPDAVQIQVSALPDLADAVLLPLVAVQLPQKRETDDANLARIRKAVAKSPDDPWGKRALAIAEAAAGDAAVAAGLLDAMLQRTPDDPVLLRWRARLHGADRSGASAADVSAARKLLVRAHKAAPNDWLTLSDYAQTFEARGKPLPESVVEVLAKAYQLAPQVSSLAYRTALAFATSGDYSAAEAVMAPLVNDPHGTDDMVLERTLLEALRTKDKAKVEAALEGLAIGRSQARLN